MARTSDAVLVVVGRDHMPCQLCGQLCDHVVGGV